MATDRELYNKGLVNNVGMSPNITDVQGAGDESQRRRYAILKTVADAVAADVTTNGVCAGNGTATYAMQFYVPNRSKLVRARLTPMANLTSSNTTYATINVSWDNGAGGAQTVCLSNTTKNTAGGGLGGFTVGQLISMTNSIITAADAHIVPATSYVQLQVAKASTGVALPAMTIELVFEEV